MAKKASTLLLLVSLFLISGCVSDKKSSDSSLVSVSTSSNANSIASFNDAVTDPYGKPITYYANNTNFPLYAALKPENIYLYGVIPYGMVLYQDGMGTYFDWPGLTPRAILPELSFLDYDNDGKRELAITLYVGAGTQWSIMDLHILKIINPTKYNYSYKPEYTDYSLLGDDVDKWMTKEFSGTLSNDKKTINLNFDGNTFQTDNWGDFPEAGKFNGVAFGDVVEFSFDNNGKIHLRIAMGAKYEHVAQTHLFGYINGEVCFVGNGFTLENCTLNFF